jgi:diacylglycerol kinase (ATP)
MNICVIINPNSSRYRDARLQELRNGSLANRHVEWVQTTRPGEATEAAASAATHGHELVVAIGGDGTVNEVINGLVPARSRANREVSLGVIPLGTANDFAASLEAPSDAKIAWNRLISGQARAVDIGYISSPSCPCRYFAVSAGLGLIGVTAIESRKMRRLRGSSLYFWSAIQAIRKYRRAPNVKISLDNGRQVEQKALAISINNTPTVGGFPLFPHARVDDGLLDAAYIDQVGLFQAVQLLLHITRGTHLDHPRFHWQPASSLQIYSDQPLPIQVDGEIFSGTEDGVHEVEIGLLPSALSVRA